MIADLIESQIDELLRKELIGRIGCHTEDMVYIVPISYAYDGKDIYAHTFEGLKVDTMRKNPNVCFEVEDLRNMANWKSVIAWGKFEELKDKEERVAALKLLLNRPLPIVSSITTHLGSTWPFSSDQLDTIKGIVFRIAITKRTGKFELSTQTTNEFD